MKKLKQIVNIALALNLLIATTGFTLHKHYCMGRVKAVSINESANTCAEKGFTDPMPCCEDVQEEWKVDQITTVSFDFDSQPELYELAIISWIAFDLSTVKLRHYQPQFRYYSPPLPEHDAQVEHQLFLL